MKILLDFLPIIIFFAVYKYTGDLIIATAVLIPATIIQVGYNWLKHKTVEKMHLVSLVLVILLGGATILLGDGYFIKWKPTIVKVTVFTLFRAIFGQSRDFRVPLEEGPWAQLGPQNASWHRPRSLRSYGRHPWVTQRSLEHVQTVLS